MDYQIPYIDLTGVTVPPQVIALVPESIARENVILPLAYYSGALKIVISDPADWDTLQKLQFMLNKDIYPVLSSRDQIVAAIDRHYEG